MPEHFVLYVWYSTIFYPKVGTTARTTNTRHGCPAYHYPTLMNCRRRHHNTCLLLLTRLHLYSLAATASVTYSRYLDDNNLGTIPSNIFAGLGALALTICEYNKELPLKVDTRSLLLYSTVSKARNDHHVHKQTVVEPRVVLWRS